MHRLKHVSSQVIGIYATEKKITEAGMNTDITTFISIAK